MQWNIFTINVIYFLLLHFSIHMFALHLLMGDFKNLVETIMILCPHLSHPKSNCVPCNNTLQHQGKKIKNVNRSLAKAPWDIFFKIPKEFSTIFALDIVVDYTRLQEMCGIPPFACATPSTKVISDNLFCQSP